MTAMQLNANLLKFLIGSQVQQLKTPAGKAFFNARLHLEDVVLSTTKEFTMDRDGEKYAGKADKWVKGILFLEPDAFVGALSNFLGGVHVLTRTILPFSGFWGLQAKYERAHRLLRTMLPGQVSLKLRDTIRRRIQTCHEMVPDVEGAGPTEIRIIKPIFTNYIAEVNHVRTKFRHVMDKQFPSFDLFWDFEGFDKLNPPKGMKDVVIFWERMLRGDGLGAVKSTPRGVVADGAKNEEVKKAERQLQSLKDQKKALEKQIRETPTVRAGSPEVQSRGRVDVQFHVREEESSAFDILFDTDDDDTGHCIQAWAHVLFPRGGKFPNGSLKCPHGDKCSKQHPPVASELVAVHGAEVVDGAKDVLKYFARKKAEGAAKRAASTPGPSSVPKRGKKK